MRENFVLPQQSPSSQDSSSHWIVLQAFADRFPSRTESKTKTNTGLGSFEQLLSTSRESVVSRTNEAKGDSGEAEAASRLVILGLFHAYQSLD